MMYISKPIKFKKQSQTLNTIIKDKQIESKKKTIKALLKTHTVVNSQLLKTKQQYTKKQQKYNAKHNQLLTHKQQLHRSLLKLTIRKYRLQVLEKPEIKDYFCDQIKKYMKGFVQFNQFSFIRYIGGAANFVIAKKFSYKFETAFYIRPELKSIIVKKHLRIWMRNKYYQNVMLTIKDRTPIKKYQYNSDEQNQNWLLLEIYSTTGPSLHIQKQISAQDYKKYLQNQPNILNNLIISIPKNKLYFISEYLSQVNYRQKIMNLINVYQFQIQVIKEKKKIVFFKCLNIRNIFQSVYSVEGYRDLELHVLIQIKKKGQDKPSQDQENNHYIYSGDYINSQKLRKTSHNLGVKGHKKHMQETRTKQKYTSHQQKQHRISKSRYKPSYLHQQESYSQSEHQYSEYTLYCQPIRSYDQKYMFMISNDIVLRNNQEQINNFVDLFLNKYMIRLDVRKLITNRQEEEEFGSNANLNSNANIGLGSNKSMENRQKGRNKYGFIQSQQARLKYQVIKYKPQLVQVIEYGSELNLPKIIKVQSAIRMNLLRKKYLITLQQKKKNMQFNFNSRIYSNIMISAYIKRQQLIFFVECLTLSAEKQKKRDYQFLHYNKIYWDLVDKFMKTQEMDRIGRKYLIWEIEEELDKYFYQSIQIYQKQQSLQNQLKPIKALNRLRRFFVKFMLKIKRKRNILDICKIEKQFGTFCIIIRRSSFLKNIVHAHLYVLQAQKKSKHKQKKSYIQNNSIQNNQVNQIQAKQQNNKQNQSLSNVVNSKQQRIRQQNNFKAAGASCNGPLHIKNDKKLRYKQISMFLQNAQILTYCSKSVWRHKYNKISDKSLQNQFHITESKFLLKPLHIQYITGKFKFIDRLTSISLTSEQIINQIDNLSSLKNISLNLNSNMSTNVKRSMIINFQQTKILRRSKLPTKLRTLSKNKLHGNKKMSTKILKDKSYYNIGQMNTNTNIYANINLNNMSNVNLNLNTKPATPGHSNFYQNKNTNDQNSIFYSIYKDTQQGQTFFIQLFLIISMEKEKNQYFKSVHKQQVSRKDIATSGWGFVYRLIALWAKNSGWCISQQERLKSYCGRDSLAHYNIVSNIQNSSQDLTVSNGIQLQQNV